MTMYEVDLRDRKTGSSVECIYSGDNYDKAYEIAEKYNKENLTDYNKDFLFSDYFASSDYFDGTNGLIADVYHIENKSELHGVGKF